VVALAGERLAPDLSRDHAAAYRGAGILPAACHTTWNPQLGWWFEAFLTTDFTERTGKNGTANEREWTLILTLFVSIRVHSRFPGSSHRTVTAGSALTTHAGGEQVPA
jgi:hypothetical protein